MAVSEQPCHSAKRKLKVFKNYDVEIGRCEKEVQSLASFNGDIKFDLKKTYLLKSNKENKMKKTYLL